MNNEFKSIFDDNELIEIDDADLEIRYQWDSEDEVDIFECEITADYEFIQEAVTPEINNVMYHIVYGDNYEEGEYTGYFKSGCHSQKGLMILKQRGVVCDNDIRELPNGVRVGNLSGHTDSDWWNGEKKSWFPANWTEKHIKSAIKTIWKNNLQQVENIQKQNLYYDIYGNIWNVRIVLKFYDGVLGTAYPPKDQNIY